MKKPHALLVDDDAQILATMGLILEMDNYQVTTAGGGQQALEKLQGLDGEAGAVDFLILDLDMGKMNGLELLSEMRRRGLEMPVMVVTGYASRTMVVELLRQEVMDFLDKPIHIEEFRARVRSLSESARKRKQQAFPASPSPRAPKAATFLELSRLGLTHAARHHVDKESDGTLMLACRKPFGYDLLFADMTGAGREGFYLSVLLKCVFDKHRETDLGARELAASMHRAVQGGVLGNTQVNMTIARIRTDDRRIEVLPCGLPTHWILGRPETESRVLAFSGTCLGPKSESPAEYYEVDYAPGERLFILAPGVARPGGVRSGPVPQGSESAHGKPQVGSGPAALTGCVENLRTALMGISAEVGLQQTLDTVWRLLESGAGERGGHDAFMLGLELP